MKVSVVIPTHNRRTTLGPAIESAVTQDVDDLEVLVVDDGSSDGTEEWVTRAWSGGVRVLRNSGLRGPAGARNTGIRAAKGSLVAFLDSDDSYLPGHLSEASRVLDRFPGVDVVFGRARYERDGEPVDYMGPNFDRKLALAPKTFDDDTLSVFGPSFLDHLLRHGCWFNLSTVVMRAATAGELLDERLRIGEDYEFWVRLARSHKFACLHRPQIRYRLHDENLSFEAAGTTAEDAPNLLETLRVIRGHQALTRAQARAIDGQIADTLFDWAYRCRLRQRWLESARLHLRSAIAGKRTANALSLMKLSILALTGGWRRRRGHG